MIVYRACNGNRVLETLSAAHIAVVMPAKSNRRFPAELDRDIQQKLKLSRSFRIPEEYQTITRHFGTPYRQPRLDCLNNDKETAEKNAIKPSSNGLCASHVCHFRTNSRPQAKSGPHVTLARIKVRDFDADLFRGPLATFSFLGAMKAQGRGPARIRAFCTLSHMPALTTPETPFAAQRGDDLTRNPTHPASHPGQSGPRRRAGCDVWSPLPEAPSIHTSHAPQLMVKENQLTLASCPGPALTRAVPRLAPAMRRNRIGTPRMITAEVEDGYLSHARFRGRRNSVSAPWVMAGEFGRACALKHQSGCLGRVFAITGALRAMNFVSGPAAGDFGSVQTVQRSCALREQSP